MLSSIILFICLLVSVFAIIFLFGYYIQNLVYTPADAFFIFLTVFLLPFNFPVALVLYARIYARYPSFFFGCLNFFVRLYLLERGLMAPITARKYTIRKRKQDALIKAIHAQYDEMANKIGK